MFTRSKPIYLDARFLDLALVAALAPALILGALWYAGRPPAATRATTPPPALTLSLSGAVTTDVRLPARDLAEVRCTPAGFFVATSPDLGPFAFTLSFQGVPGATGDAAYVLGPGVGPLALRVEVDGGRGSSFHAVDGNVTSVADSVRFAATLQDEQGTPLYLSGLLACP